MKLISGGANPRLGEAIAENLGVTPTKIQLQHFADTEVFVEILDNVRGEDVFVVQPTHTPVNDNLMSLLVMIDALKRGSAHRITAVIPYYGYARQDRKTGPRTPISAKLVARMLEGAGAQRVLTMDLHATQIQGFFEIPTDNLYALPIFLEDIAPHGQQKDPPLLFVSPDVGGVPRTRAMAKHVPGSDLAIIDKRRPRAGIAEVMNVIGSPQGCRCILVDDIVDSAGTLCSATDALLERGAVSVSAYVTHGVLSGEAVARIEASHLKEVVVTDSIRATERALSSPKLRYVSVAPLFAEAINRIRHSRSISSLFV